ncbi:MAG: PQQ-binding-like beta-propeller repeat protein, partial [Planctomycetes bacterium]|nr:PQQ-binding-like beta-propeller repeat protein [Planctomycetota bacterium]
MAAAGQPSTGEPVAPDTCILELDLPPGAGVTIDGRDYGTRRRLVYRTLERGKRYATRIQIRFADGTQAERQVCIEAGRVIRERCAPPGDRRGPTPNPPPPARPRQPPNHGRPELVLQTGHARSVQCAALTLDGRHLATGGYDGTLILWDVTTGHKLRAFEGRDESGDGRLQNVQSVAFSPDGKLLLSGTNETTALLWDKITGAKLRTFRAGVRHHQIHSVAFSPDGGKVLMGCNRGVSLWDTASGSQLQAFRPNSDSSVQTAAFGPSGAHVVTGDDKGIATLWSATTGKVVRTFKQAPANAAGFSMESLTQAFGANLPAAASGNMEESLRESLLTPRIRAVALNSDDTRLATAVSDGRVTLWDARTGGVLRTLERKGSGGAKSVAFSRDGRRLLCCSDLDATLWDVATGTKLQASVSPTASVTFGPEGTRMLSGHQDGTVSLWDTEGMKRLWSVSAARGQVHVVAFDPGGKEFATASMMDPSVTFRDVASGKELRRLRLPPMMTSVHPFMASLLRSQGTDYDNMGGAMFAAYGAGGRRLVTASMHVDMGHVFDSLQSAKPKADATPQQRPRQTLKLIAWDVATGEEVWSVDTDMYASFLSGTTTLSPDRRMLLSGGPSRIVVWDVETGQEVYRLPGRSSPNPLQGAAFSPNGRHLLVCSGGASASLLDLKTGEEIGKFTGRGGYVYCVAFSPNGEKALTGSTDKTAILWDAATGKRVHELRGHDDAILFMAFSPDGARLLMSGKNSSTLWDTATGDLLHTLPGGLGLVPQLSDCFTPDSRLVLTRSTDGKCNVWDVETGKSVYDSRGLSGGPICSALSSGGEPVVVGRLLQGGLAISDAVSGDVLGTIREHSASVSSLSVARGTGEMLASVGSGQGLVLWDGALERNAPLKLGDTLFGSSSHATISPDGRRALDVQ